MSHTHTIVSRLIVRRECDKAWGGCILGAICAGVIAVALGANDYTLAAWIASTTAAAMAGAAWMASVIRERF